MPREEQQMTMTDLATRDGLPDALRVLLEQYPRDAWEADRNFSGLIRFWLERHLMFRRLLAGMQDDLQKRLDTDIDAKTHAARLSRFGGMFLNELHGHHSIEDQHYFPKLVALDTRLGRGFDILDRDHHAIDGHLHDFATAANALIQSTMAGEEDKDSAAGMEKVLATSERFLNRHLEDEEDLVVPILLKFAPAGLV